MPSLLEPFQLIGRSARERAAPRPRARARGPRVLELGPVGVPGSAAPDVAARPRRKRLRTIFVSDLHLGTKGAQAGLLVEFLERHECETLYLVGDVIDGWSLRRAWHWDRAHERVVEELLAARGRGTRVVYVCGNHDEFLRAYVGHVFAGIEVVDEAVHETARGERLLVVHGDRFDACIRHARWLALVGARAYEACLLLNRWLALARRKLGYGYWSLSAWLKSRVKTAVSHIADFESAVLREARARGLDGAVCGHIHQAALRNGPDGLYANDGDWVESCTALVEDAEGRLALIDWGKRRELQLARERRRGQRNVGESQPLRAPAPAGA